jgi:uncharacterized protein YkuJ
MSSGNEIFHNALYYFMPCNTIISGCLVLIVFCSNFSHIINLQAFEIVSFTKPSQMKTFCLTIMMSVSLLCITIGIQAQPINDMAWINTRQNQNEHFPGYFSKGEKNTIQYPGKFKASTRNQPIPESAGNHQPDSSISEYWDNTNSLWVREYKSAFAYDANGNNTVLIRYVWNNITSQWGANYKEESTFDANGNKTLLIDYSWNNSTSQWVSYYKVESTYDANGNKTLLIDYSWNNSTSQWVSHYKVESTYDANGSKTLLMGYLWNNNTSQWVVEYKEESTYDANGNNTLLIRYDWHEDWPIPDYVYKDKSEYTFDVNGNITLVTLYTWDSYSEEWEPIIQSEYTYDETGNITLLVIYAWDSNTSEWTANYKYEYAYDANGNKTLSIQYFWDNATTHLWYLGFAETWYYSDITGVNKINEKHLRVYPNPTAAYVVFDITPVSKSSEVEIFDVQGRSVIRQKLAGNNRISINDLPKGLYLYRLHDGGNMYMGKVIVE